MNAPRTVDRSPLRLNARVHEAFLRGGPRRGALAVHRKLDGAALATGRWRATPRGVVLALEARSRATARVRAALAELAPLLARCWPRAVLRVRIAAGRHVFSGALHARGGHPRPASPDPASATARRRIAAALREVPADYAATRHLPRVAEARILAFAGIDVSGRECWLRPDVARRWRALHAHAARAGIALELVSGFRSAAYQARIVERKRARGETLQHILTVNAAPGHSEHHGGRAADLGTPGTAPVEGAFEHTPAFAWLQTNATRFRLRLSYPRDNPHGIVHEPWHWFFDD
jgi:D-alanyl-D-alanine carboxypeptidase